MAFIYKITKAILENFIRSTPKLKTEHSMAKFERAMSIQQAQANPRTKAPHRP